MSTQYILTAAIVSAATAYAAWRIYIRLKHADRCEGCTLAARCRKHGKEQQCDKGDGAQQAHHEKPQ